MIRVCDDPENLSRAAAELFTIAAQRAVAARGRFSVVLAGGSTPRRSYQMLARPPVCNQVPWAQVHVFWGDERCVPPHDPRSNARMAHEALLGQVPLPAAQVHPMNCTGDPAAAARDYQQQLKIFFGKGEPRFDLILLGLGSDGHTASLFPDSPALAENTRWVVETRKPEEDFSRTTLTLPLINHAALVVFLVAGESKTAILRQMLAAGATDPPLPAQLIRPQPGELLWLVDRAAAGE